MYLGLECKNSRSIIDGSISSSTGIIGHLVWFDLGRAISKIQRILKTKKNRLHLLTRQYNRLHVSFPVSRAMEPDEPQHPNPTTSGSQLSTEDNQQSNPAKKAKVIANVHFQI